MKRYFFTGILFFAFAAVGQQLVVPARITAGAATNFYTVVNSAEVSGGSQQVPNLTARDAIAVVQRKEGMTCWVVSETNSYRLVGGIDNTNWQVALIGSGSSNAISAADAGLDAASVMYANSAGVTNTEDRLKINSFVMELKAGGLWSSFVDAYLFRSNLNGGTIRSFTGALPTKQSNPKIGLGGVTFTNSAAGGDQAMWFTLPIAVTNHTVIVGLRGTITEPSTASPWQLGNSAGLLTAGVDVYFANNFGAFGHVYTRQNSTVVDASSVFVQSITNQGWSSNDPRYQTPGVGYGGTTIVPYRDGLPGTTISGASVVQITSPLSVFTLGGRQLTSGSIDLPWGGVISEALIFNKQLSRAEIATAERALRWLYPSDRNIVGIGDSMTSFNLARPTNSWLWQYESSAQGTNRVRIYNIALSGTAAADWVTAYTNASIYGTVGAVKSADTYVLLGINDCYVSGSSIITDPSVTALNVMAIDSGLAVYGHTMHTIMMPTVWSNAAWSTNIGGPGAWGEVSTNEFARQRLISILSTNGQFSFIRADSVFTLDNMNTNNAGTYSLDGLHLNDAGNAVLMNAIMNEVIPLSTPSGQTISAGSTNLWQPDGSIVSLNGTLYVISNRVWRLISGSVTGDGNAAHYLDGTGSYSPATVASSNIVDAYDLNFAPPGFSLTTNGLQVTISNTVSIYDSTTNTWTINTDFGLGTNSFMTSGAATGGITGLANKPASGERFGRLVVLATGDLVFTNPPTIHCDDFVSSRTITNGNTATITVDIVVGQCTNLFIRQSK